MKRRYKICIDVILNEQLNLISILKNRNKINEYT